MEVSHLLFSCVLCFFIVSTVSSTHPIVYEELSLYTKIGNETKKVADLGLSLPSTRSGAKSCSSNNEEVCYEWDDGTKLEITNDDSYCSTISWKTLPSKPPLVDCFALGGYNWYGGPERKTQYWPLEKFNLDMVPVVTHEKESQAIADPFWFNSDGLSIMVDKGVPLFIDQNSYRDNGFCLVAKIAPPYRQRTWVILKYQVCKLQNPRDAFTHAVTQFLGKPRGIPDERMITHPIWSTWARYKSKIDDKTVREFAEEIIKNGFENSQIEIDDKWETCYGSCKFDKTRFPNMKELSMWLKTKNFRVTLWTHPFINEDCHEHLEAEQNGYLVRNYDGSDVTNWWNGKGSTVDFTKPSAAKWWENRHKIMMEENGIDGLKFDAGETSFMPQLPALDVKRSIDEEYPQKFTSIYTRLCATFGPLTEVRSAYRTQDLPIFLRMIDKDSKWGYDNGLRTLVTTLLQMNMVGYSFVLPDMIGGNAYNNEKPTAELFIRWLQANTFMPSVQYSIVPWDYSREVVNIARKFMEIRGNYSAKIIELMKKNAADGSPVNPPVWWIDPTDKEAQCIDSEYLLGEDILVAPVMEEFARERDIYLPRGKWRDDGNGGANVYQGPVWLRKHRAPLDVLPYFVRVDKDSTVTSPKPPTDAPTATPSTNTGQSVTLDFLCVLLLVVRFVILKVT